MKRIPTPDEITLSNDGMLSKEALQLIDGSSFQVSHFAFVLKTSNNAGFEASFIFNFKFLLSSFDPFPLQRFYKMRTRRQNSSTDESTKSGIKRRISSRSNSGNSKASEEGGEVKRRSRQGKGSRGFGECENKNTRIFKDNVL